MAAVETQNASILADLMAGREVTALDALDRHGCLRLSGRIYDLKQAGHDIKSQFIKVEKADGSLARVKEYWL